MMIAAILGVLLVGVVALVLRGMTWTLMAPVPQVHLTYTKDPETGEMGWYAVRTPPDGDPSEEEQRP